MSGRLEELERAIRDNVAPATLWAMHQALDATDLAVPGGDARRLLARGTIQNRLRLPGEALSSLMEARALALEDDSAAWRSDISRQIALVHSWRGQGHQAALELLRACREAIAANDQEGLALAIAASGRLAREIGRFDEALAACETALSMPALPARERARLLPERLKALNSLGRHHDCIASAEAVHAALGESNFRLRWLAAMEEIRALATIGEIETARLRLTEAEKLLPEDRSEWEWTEHRELAAGLYSPSADREHLRSLVESYRDDRLYIREAEARLALAEAYLRDGEAEPALAEAAAAVRLAERERSETLVERGRTIMLSSGRQIGSDADDAASLLTGRRYVFGAMLGRGGYGVVRRAYDLESGQERAIKIVDLSGLADPARRSAMLRDARAEIESARLARHPGLVQIHAAFVEGDRIVIVQDFVPGRPLQALVSGVERVVLIDIFERIAHALGALHEAGVVHRDLKPDNVIVRPNGHPVIIDMGLSAIAGSGGDGPARGTEPYAAPEMKGAGVPPHPAQDAYALGVMLAEFMPDLVRKGPLGLFRRAAGTGLPALVEALRSPQPERRPTMREAATLLELARQEAAVAQSL